MSLNKQLLTTKIPSLPTFAKLLKKCWPPCTKILYTVMTTQLELNLLMQRQADATYMLRDKLRKQQVRYKHQSEQVDPTKLKPSIREVLRSNPELVGPGQVEHQTPPNGTEHKAFDKINSTMERSVSAAATNCGHL
ncbi:hypothetical protein PHMEG_00020692 [Phytophthora megakarya]|uniref:Uncharacterized protein n=1 Tax=Phytophthora megakarya TaxID=4795 RepID=A0A225VPM8_9STRA|nr:hypothetical protein PHMEG_00020692 [Phytophthora megakarya]